VWVGIAKTVLCHIFIFFLYVFSIQSETLSVVVGSAIRSFKPVPNPNRTRGWTTDLLCALPPARAKMKKKMPRSFQNMRVPNPLLFLISCICCDGTASLDFELQATLANVKNDLGYVFFLDSVVPLIEGSSWPSSWA
jgi:hypothetical protein